MDNNVIHYELMNNIFDELNKYRKYDEGFTYSELIDVIKRYNQIKFSQFENYLFKNQTVFVNGTQIFHDADVRKCLLNSIR